MATTKTLLLNAVTGEVVPGAGVNSFEITDPSFFKGVKIEGLAHDDHLTLMRHNHAGDDWVTVTTGEGVTPVQLNRGNTSVTPVHIGTYALKGTVAGTITAYTEE